MKMKLVALFLACTMANAATAITYDAVADFSTTNNPNGVWRYGYSTLGPGEYEFKLLDDHIAGFDWNWFDTSYVSSYAPTIWKNYSSTTSYDGVAPGQLSLHPGPNNYSPTILRFIAPTTGNYDVFAKFFAGDSNTMNAAIFLNGSQLQYWNSTDGLPEFNKSMTITAGSTLDFAVGNNGNFGWGNTPVAVTITTAVPEPDGYAMLLAGLGILGGIARIRRR